MHQIKKIKAIFIQNFFRSGGSYLFNQFIDNENIMGFYEPFHEDLSDLEKIDVARKEFQKRKKQFNHPNKEFYFQNFPLNKEWFENFHKTNVKLNFFNIKNQSIPVVQEYLKNLISYSASFDRLPLFKINRLYLNPEILELDGVYKIFLFREPISTFISNIRLNLLRPYYNKIFQLANEEIEPFKSLWNLVVSNNINNITFEKEKINFASKKDMEIHYSIFFFIWLFGLYKNFKFDYTFINYSKLDNLNYSKKITEEISNNCGVKVKFSNFVKNKDKTYDLQIHLNEKIIFLINKFMNREKIDQILFDNFDILLKKID